MRFLRLFVALVLMQMQPALAQITEVVTQYSSEIHQRKAAHDAWINYNHATETMRMAMQRGGVGWAQRYAQSWGGWWWLDWNSASNFYGTAERELWNWQRAVQAGIVSETQAEQVLDRGMIVLRNLDAHIHTWFSDDLAQYAERGRWLDRAHAIGCCEAEYQWLNAQADNAFADSISPDYNALGRIRVFPPVPTAGEATALPGAPMMNWLNSEALAAISSGDAVRIRQILRTGRIFLDAQDLEQQSEIALVLAVLDDRLRFSSAPVDIILDQVASLPPGPARDSLLELANDGLLDRAGHLASLMAAGAEASSEEQRQSLRTRLIENAKRIIQLRDDVRGVLNGPSGASRFFSGLNAASQALDLANSDNPQARDMAKVLSDAAETGPGLISPIAPFSGPMGAVSAQIDQTKRAWDHASEALDGVSAAIGGDPSGLERAQVAAKQLETALNPKVFVREMADGFVDGIANNVPFARSIIGWLRD